jgi:nucleoside-diphosphate-sugar epimerase
VRIAVTGASGFVGRHVVAECQRRSLPIIAATHKHSLDAESADIIQVKLDLHDLPSDTFKRLGSPQILVHLVWGTLNDYRSSSHVERELPAHLEFLTTMVKAGVSHIVVAGTCLEYGMQSGALDEKLETKPVVPYAAAKDSLRRGLELLKLERDFGLTWARLFYLYGEGQREASLFGQMERAAARGDKTFQLSGGEQQRDYLHVAEAARLLIELTLSGQSDGVVNVCSGEPISIRDLTKAWVVEFGWPFQLDFGRRPYNDYEPMEFWGTRSKLERCIAGARAVSR